MADSLRILRGNKSDMPANLGAGVLAECLDTKEVYIGDGDSNLKIAMYEEVLPITGGTVNGEVQVHKEEGTPFFVFNDKSDGIRSVIGYRAGGARLGKMGFDGVDNPVFVTGNDQTAYKLLHTGNKPSGSYTGNGNDASRVIATGGIGGVCIVTSEKGIAILTKDGAVITKNTSGSTSEYLGRAAFTNGNIETSTTNEIVNASGITYTYYVL